jgi:hypothetical protein
MANMVGARRMCCKQVRDDVAQLVARGERVTLITAREQCYAIAEAIVAPSPPWDSTSYDILIAIPALYRDASLDAFYLALPYRFGGAEHNRVSGETIEVSGRQWRLVSWHYPDGKPWKDGQDNLETHIAHCRGFFLQRGAVNDR